MANKKILKKYMSLSKILRQRPKRRAGQVHKFQLLFYYMKKASFALMKAQIKRKLETCWVLKLISHL